MTAIRRAVRVVRAAWPAAAALALLAGCASAPHIKSYDQYVWPPPPDPPRIQLEDVVLGRMDVRAKTSGLQRKLLHDAQQSPPLWPSLLEGAICIDVPLNAPRSADDEFVYWAN